MYIKTKILIGLKKRKKETLKIGLKKKKKTHIRLRKREKEREVELISHVPEIFFLSYSFVMFRIDFPFKYLG